MIIKIILLAFIGFAGFKLVKRHREGAISTRWFLLWLVFWIGAAVVITLPQISQRLAELVGLGRGVDLALSVAVLVLYYIVFRLMVRIERMERNISKIVEELAIREKNKE